MPPCRSHHWAFIVGFLMLAAAAPRSARALEPVVITANTTHIALGRHVETMAETDRVLTIGQISSGAFDRSFSPSAVDVPNFGFTRTAHWARLELQSALPHRQELLLEIAYPVLDLAEVYIERADTTFSKRIAGDTQPFDQREITHANLVFPLMLDPGQRIRIYLRAQTEGSLQLPLHLWTPRGLMDRDYQQRLLQGLLFGLLVVMLLYNLFLYLSIWDRSYLYYVLMVSCAMLYQGTATGVAQQYLWPSFPWLSNPLYSFFLYGTLFFGLLLPIRLLDMKERHPVLYRVMLPLTVVSGACTPLALALPYGVSIRILPVLALLACVLALIAPIVSLRWGFKPARFFLAGWTAFYIGVILWAANKLDLLPVTPLTENAHIIGFALNMVLLSFSLADRINVMRQETASAQAQALELQHQAAEILEREVAAKTLDLKERTAELEQAYARLAEQDRIKSQFFANVSHELRTPLTLIATPLARLLEAGDLSTSARDRLHSMMGNTQRLLRLVNQLLDFSRLESGSTAVSYELLDVRRLAEPIVEGFQVFARSKGLTLTLRGPEQLPAIYTDQNKLDKVLCNLLSNACKFTEPGGTVVVRLGCDVQRGELTLSVMDSGIGIAHEDQEQIFARFGQVDSSASRKYEGTGIGLALSKELTALMGGRLEVQSEPGVGSTFTVTLPLGRQHITDPSRIRPTEPDAPHTGQSILASTVAALSAEDGHRNDVVSMNDMDRSDADQAQDTGAGKPLLLIVEDNPDIRALICDICGHEFRVRGAGDGEQGLTLARQHLPALVIADIMMPKMDGYELLHQIRKDPLTSAIPVMLLTAKVGPEMRLEGLELGADDYLTKPFEPRELLARARNLVRLQEQERRLRELNARLHQEVVEQTMTLEQHRMLQRYLPPQVARLVLAEGLAPGPSHQRRRLTIFRIELRGFDRVVEMCDAEDMATMLNSYLSEMMDAAFSHGATVTTLVRDTLVGLFGAPENSEPERDAVRCARLAIELLERAVTVCDRWAELGVSPPPDPVVVMASGHATVGSLGSTRRLEYTAVGGPVDEVAALLPVMEPCTVSCNQPAWFLIQNEIPGEPCGTVHVKHRVHPVQVYRLARADRQRPPSRPLHDTITKHLPFEGGKPLDRMPLSIDNAQAMGQAIEPGQILDERYQIIRQLGEGGMGSVYLAHDQKLGADVALKMLRADASTDTGALARLYREIKLARLVSHANVAHLYDLGEWHGREFISMEYIEGQSLAERIEVEGGLPLLEGLQILSQVCEGLGAAHTAGIIHRDLKPSNIMLEVTGRAVILDFGIAKWTSEQHSSSSQSHGIPGTPQYMAPEQFEEGVLDQRTDIYSLGVMAFELFTGQRPFDADSLIRMAYAHINQLPPDPLSLRSDLPPRLAAVILRCLEKRPQDRFGSVREVAALLQTASGPELL